MEQRRYDRIRVNYFASFVGRAHRIPGTLVNLSMGGCRAEVAFTINPNEYIRLLIHVPGDEEPLYVSRAEVRWLKGQEVGMEFIHIESEQRQRLSDIIRTIGGPDSRARDSQS